MHIEHFEYDIEPNEKGEMVAHFKVGKEEHTLGLTERDLKRMLKFLELSKNKQ